jgi:hypothetical protein
MFAICPLESEVRDEGDIIRRNALRFSALHAATVWKP